ncbi:MAG: hypothetical protein QS748_14040 [Candidatus Endonucleobacter bathymodioli]|uniref:Uncharacterized protein n=1 Tax=Candidatus Endonucleibacter bathymodioli TaxID=539814 RepID=A0AA90NTP7_9GAMM|nr:hypothetical protein [Candidatus Endonucleobacter bathymodioli]
MGFTNSVTKNESQLKNILEMISEQELRDCLSQLKDDGQVEAKLFILKDHEYYHCILLQTVIGIRRHYSTKEYGTPHSFTDKYVARRKACESIIQAKIKQLTSEGRYFEKRSHFVSKRSDSSSMKVRAREEELEGKPLKAKHSNARYHDKASENSVCASVLLYMSKGRERNLNCKVYHNRELVVCRHLSAWWLQLKEFEYGDIDSEENIARCKKIPCPAELNKSFNHKVYPSEGIYFEISQFNNVIYDVATSLSEGQEKRYLVNSSNHGMGLCIKGINI